MQAPLQTDWRRAAPPPLGASGVHVWRIHLDDASPDALAALLSGAERAQAARFYRAIHRDRYIVAHAMLRRVLASYTGVPPVRLAFATATHGKPSLVGAHHLEFNLSHSDALALVAVARGRPLGVDVEKWNPEIEHLDLSEKFFSPNERTALRSLAPSHERLVEGFFAAWSRKEAYIKATGYGVTRGLDHFDVSLIPEDPPHLIEDRLDAGATQRWRMEVIRAAPGFSAALVCEAPVDEVLLFDAAAIP